MNLEKLNLKYKIVQLNQHWNYFNENNIERDLLSNISNQILNGVISDDSPMIGDYLLQNMDSEMIKNIVRNFFCVINISLSDKVEFAINNTKFIEESGRSVTNEKGIIFYYKKDSLKSLVDYAHEVSHAIANLSKLEDGNIDIEGKIEDAKQLSEIESLLTEDMFLEYLLVKDEYDIRSKQNDSKFTMQDLKKVRYDRLRKDMKHVKRVPFELWFQQFMKDNGYTDITPEVIQQICKTNNINLMDCYNKIDSILSHYCSKNRFEDILRGNSPLEIYDEHNGEHLSNECRFIYADCFLERFNNMDLSFDEKKKFYSEYLEKAKKMNLEEVCKKFKIGNNPLSISENFITSYISSFDEHNVNVRRI